MEKVCKKCAPKTSPRPHFNFDNLPKTPNAYKKLWKKRYFEERSTKNLKKDYLIFSFAPSPFFWTRL